MPINIHFMTPTGRTFKSRDAKGIDKAGLVMSNSAGKLAQFTTYSIAVNDSVCWGANELLGIVSACCLIFQRLVARTPLDEEYDYININELNASIQSGDGSSTYDLDDFKEHHKPDNERIRDKWTMSIDINGVIAVKLKADQFEDKIYDTPGDKNSIRIIQDFALDNLNLNLNTSDSSISIDYDITFMNKSNYFDKLEYGKYRKGKDGIHNGDKYQHGVTKDGYSIQAPSGFYRKTMLDLHSVLSTASKSRSVTERLIRNYVEKNPNIQSIERKFSKLPEVKDLRRVGVKIKFDKMTMQKMIKETLKLKSLREKMLNELAVVDKSYERDESHYMQKVDNIYSYSTIDINGKTYKVPSNEMLTRTQIIEEFNLQLGDYYEKVNEIESKFNESLGKLNKKSKRYDKNVKNLNSQKKKDIKNIGPKPTPESVIEGIREERRKRDPQFNKFIKSQKEVIKYTEVNPDIANQYTFKSSFEMFSSWAEFADPKLDNRIRMYETDGFGQLYQTNEWVKKYKKKMSKIPENIREETFSYPTLSHIGWLAMKKSKKAPIVNRYIKQVSNFANRLNGKKKPKKKSKRRSKK